MDLASEKKRLRERVGALRDAMTAQDHADCSGAICEKLWRLCCDLAHARAGVATAIDPTADLPRDFALAAYMPHRSEADIAPLIERLWRAGLPVALPKAERRERQLRFYYACGTPDLAIGAYGIREPLPTLPEATDDELAALDVLLVPGLAFDESLGRLGYGGGYYDRLLARLDAPLGASPATPLAALTGGGSATRSAASSTHANPPAPAPRRRPLLVAAAFELQLVDAVPTEPHDFPLDAIVTERRVILRRG